MGNKLKDKVHCCKDKTFLRLSIDTAAGGKHTLPSMKHRYNVFLSFVDPNTFPTLFRVD